MFLELITDYSYRFGGGENYFPLQLQIRGWRELFPVTVADLQGAGPYGKKVRGYT